MKRFRLIEALVVIGIIAMIAGVVIAALKGDKAFLLGVRKVEIDGHSYLKTDANLVHSESCQCKK